ncbi:GSCOCT00014208001.2-RA-CDS [Cotesia congregata]|uniref:Cc_bv6.9_28.2_pseudo n=1 Tax=Cotesia congregata TaxID=51543 RepID=A0A8J2HB15_COTCN|nr:GSCOCT00014208001.2-RA-CDS [Cotesia congregata]CAG5092462.1 cc_bv6.9_28.2_pseudo [Cotesia congregata]
MSSSSSSSSFAPSKNSAFSPYNKYTNKSICIVPKEWKEYSKTNMDAVLQNRLTNH